MNRFEIAIAALLLAGCPLDPELPQASAPTEDASPCERACDNLWHGGCLAHMAGTGPDNVYGTEDDIDCVEGCELYATDDEAECFADVDCEDAAMCSVGGEL